MKKTTILLFLFFISLIGIRLYAESDTLQPTCDFNMYSKGSEGCNMYIYYAGNAPNTATFTWGFDGATIISGSGIGPYTVVWNSAGWKTVTLTVTYGGQSCNNSKLVHIVGMPVVYNMTGGGSYPSGGSGVQVGLSGSQSNYTYYLYLNGATTSHYAIGTGSPVDFGLITAAGTYTCQAKVDSCNCMRLMDGTAVVTITGYVYNQYICMVTFDTTTQKNKVVRYSPCNPSLKAGEYESVVSNTATSAPLGVIENNTSGVKVYPNPAHDKLFIVLPSPLSSDVTLGIYSMDGRKMIEQHITGLTNELDLSGIPAGLYILKIKNDNGMLVKRIIKE